ncbi:autotransporter outer membrane beta-barrel domain-containing protein [Acidithiobacillus thiooxidans]|uniref:autotransporter outer membrane beta-barrel domain-containing protein n=1 Tax=Acidithiobacillus thiooxidans TaxID=930 RepID=UPI001C079072|nr:autotransporter outer membrane beta-barrel domain-containing protein [Acidithiobacillus thiooxidans]MBU2843558.1 autotransporter outer membrane beta-barrel domain-containing protein [Acidithiobacillus thiooxidans]
MKKQMKMKAIIAAVALAVSPLAMATNYSGTTTIGAGQTVTIDNSDTITQPSQFDLSDGGVLNITYSGMNTSYNPNLGVVKANGGTIDDTTEDYGGYTISGGTGFVADQNTGTLTMDTTSTDSPENAAPNIEGNQSLEANSLIMAGPDSQVLDFGASGVNTTEDLAGGIVMGDAQTADQTYGITEDENSDVTLGNLSIDGSGFITAASNGSNGSNTSSLDIENGDLDVSGPDGLTVTAAYDSDLTVNLNGSTVDVPDGINFISEEASATAGTALNIDAENATFDAGTSVNLDAEISNGAPAGTLDPVLNADLNDSTIESNLDIETNAESQTPNVNVNANNLTVDGNLSVSGIQGGNDVIFNSDGGSFGSIDSLEGGATLNLQSVSVGSQTVNPGNAAEGSIDLIGGTLNANDVSDTGETTMYGGNLNIQSGGMSANSYQQYGGNLSFLMTPNSMSKLTATDGYDISGGDVLINAATGKYSAGLSSPFLQSAAGAKNTFSPTNVYYVYNGADSSKIDGFGASIYSTSDSESVCLGGNCGTSTPTPTPSSPSSPSPSPSPAPTPEPAPIKVQVVTPVQETQKTVVSAPNLTFTQVKDASQTLVSTGVVGGGPRGLWFKGMGGTQSQSGGYHGANYGIITGYGFSVGQQKRDVAGIAFSAGQSGLGTGSQNYAKASDYALWAYGTYYPNASRDWKFAGTVGAGLSSNTVSSTSLGLPQIANFGGHFISSEIRASYWNTLDGFTISPRLSLGYTQSWTNGFTTKGGSFLDVHVSSASSGQFYIEPAVLVGKELSVNQGKYTLFPQIRAGIVENIGTEPSAMVSSGQVAAQVAGLGYPHTQGMAEVRLDMTSHTKDTNGLSGNLAVRQLFGGGASSTEAIATLKYRW